jgi:hypothetical protein
MMFGADAANRTADREPLLPVRLLNGLSKLGQR